MFPGRYFPRRYYTGRYWTKTGAALAALAMCGTVIFRAIYLGRPRVEPAHKGDTTATAAHKGRAGFGCPAD